METPKGKNFKKYVCLYEALGTACLLITFNWSGPDAQAIAISIFASIIMYGQVSGGHFNPAVTIAVFIKETFMNGNMASNLMMATIVILSQLVGATAGVTFVGLILTHITPPIS
mgnify:CR=1 FL=1|jgi:glycerol uptake facilitator-like aquaporin